MPVFSGKRRSKHRSSKEWERLGLFPELSKASVAAVWSARGKLRLESRQEGHAGPVGQPEEFRFYFKCQGGSLEDFKNGHDVTGHII